MPLVSFNSLSAVYTYDIVLVHPNSNQHGLTSAVALSCGLQGPLVAPVTTPFGIRSIAPICMVMARSGAVPNTYLNLAALPEGIDSNGT